MTQPAEISPFKLSTFTATAMVLGVAVALVVVRLFFSPPDMMENDQQAPASYILDAHLNGYWICQHDEKGNICSKPPLYTWLAGSIVEATGKISTLALYIPTALAITGVALMLLAAGCAYWDTRAGLLAALAFLFSHLAIKHMALARTDALFVLTVTATGLLAFHAWTRQRGWVWFWLAATASTFTKGPVGLLLVALGLTAAFWERSARELLARKVTLAAGFGLFLLICGSWWWLAYQQEGHGLFDKMIRSELVDHALEPTHRSRFLEFFKPLLHFISRFVPWGIIALAEVWRVLKNPSPVVLHRRFERFLFCWLTGGLLVFSLAAKHRPDHILPLLPPAALLAGCALSRWLRAVKTRALLGGTLVVAIAVVVGAILYYNNFRPNESLIARTQGMKDFAQQINSETGREIPLTYVDSPFALQFYLETMRGNISAERAAVMLTNDTPCFVAVQDYAALKKTLGNSATIYDVAHWPADGESFVRIISNRPKLEETPTLAFGDGSFRIMMTNARLLGKKRGTYNFTATNRDFVVEVMNESDTVRLVKVIVESDGRQTGHGASLKSGEKLRVADATPVP